MDEFANKRYRLEGEIGRGGMGVVYRATDRLLGQTVAVKRVFTPSEELIFASISDSVDRRLALAREFQVLASLWHPNVISVLDYGFDANHLPYFTMDLLNDAQRVTEYARMCQLSEKIALFWQILLALKYLHRRGVLHRDLKPANVLVSEKQVKVLDFGLAVAHTGEQFGGNSTSGTLAYMAPEVVKSGTTSERSDLYAAGLIAYEMFTGGHPFHVHDVTKLLDDVLYAPLDLSALHDIPIKLTAIIERLTAKSPDERFGSADEVLAALSEVADARLVPETQATRESFLRASEFVGRGSELQQLVDLLPEVENRRGGLWLIGGESGVGKSRLVNELRARALVRGIAVARGQEVSEGGQLYQLWREVLKLMALYTPLSDTATSVLKPIIPDVETLLARSVADPPVLPPQAAHQRLLGVVTELFQAQQEALVVILEDVHWSSVSLDLLRALIPELEALPVLIIATYRDDERPDLPKLLPGAHILKVNRLSSEAMADLSASMIGQAGRSPEVVRFLQRETEGNVFFAVEVVRALAEEYGELDKIGGNALPDHIFSGGIQQIVRRRLNRINTQEYPLLQMAAIFGRQMDEELLKAASPNTDVARWLIGCANAAILTFNGETWSFSHDKLREALLAEMPLVQQTALHRQAAQLMETIHPENYASLAYHWRKAGMPDNEIRYVVLAAKEAHRQGAVDDAIRYYRRAIELLMRQPDNPERTVRELDLQLDLGANQLAGEGYGSAAVFQTYERARQLCQQIGATPQYFKVLSGLNVFYILQAKLHTAQELAEQAVKMADVDHDSALYLEAYRMMAAATFWSGQAVLSDEYMVKCYQVYDPVRHRTNIVTYGQDSAVCVLANGGWLKWFLGYPDLARATCRKAIELAESLNHAFSLCFALSFQNYLWLTLGDAKALRSGVERLSKLATENGIRSYAATAMGHQGGYMLLTGQYQEALKQFQAARPVLQRVGNELHVPFLMNLMAETYLRMGNCTEGLKVVREAFELLNTNETRAFMPELYRLQGELMLHDKARAPTEALDSLHQALDLARQMSLRSLELRAAMSLYRVLGDSAHSDLETAYNWFTEGLDTPDLRAAKALLNEP